MLWCWNVTLLSSTQSQKCVEFVMFQLSRVTIAWVCAFTHPDQVITVLAQTFTGSNKTKATKGSSFVSCVYPKRLTMVDILTDSFWLNLYKFKLP